MNTLTPIIAQRLGLGQEQVDNTLALLDAGCTIPFIARYRKERTGNLNEVQIAQISELYEKLQELEKRKEAMWSVSKPTGDQMSAKEQEDEARAKGAAPENKKAYAYDAEKGWYKPADKATDPGKVAC